MLRFQHLILCASLLLVCEHAVAQGPPKSGKRYDEALHSYVFEPSDDFSDFQADATTAYPPLVEYEANTVSFFPHNTVLLWKWFHKGKFISTIICVFDNK